MPVRSTARLVFAGMVLVTTLPSAAFASESAAVLQQYFDGFRKLGATRVDHGPIEDDPATGTATVRDISVELPFTFEFGKAGSFTVQFSIEQPDFTIVNAERADGGYRVEKAETLGVTTARVTVTGIDDFQIASTVEDWKGEGLYWPDLPTIRPDPDRPISRYYPLLRWVASAEGDRVSIRRMEIDQTGPASARQHTVYNDLLTTDQRAGVAGTVQIGRTVAETYQPIPAPAEQPDAEPQEKLQMTYEVGSVRYRNYDIGRLIGLFDPESHALGTSDRMYYPVLDEGWANDIVLKIDGAQIRVGRYGGTGFGMRRPTENVLAFADRLARGEEPGERDAVRLALDILGTIAMERLTIDDVSVTPPPGEKGNGKLERMTVRNLSADRLGEFSIDGLAIAGPDGITVDLERFALKDLVFPTVQSILALTDFTQQNPGQNPPPSLVLPVIPLLYEIETRGFAVTKPDVGTISLKSAFSRFANHIGPIPTTIETKVEKFDAPTAAIDDPEGREMFERMGLDRMVFNEEVVIRWDEATEELIIDPVVFDIEGAGKIAFSARFAGVPRFVFENPEAAQQALATLAFTSARLQIDNERLMQAAMEKAAEDKGISLEESRAEILMQIRQGAQQLQDPALAQMIGDAVGNFLANPQTLTIEARPNAPMPLTQIMGLAAVAPQAIVKQLGIVVRSAP